MPLYSLRRSESIWLLLSLAVPLYFGLISLWYSFSHAYVVQDDARLHVVWLQRFVNPALFADDLIAQYYQAIQADGFKALYWAMAKLGIEPLLLAKLLPTGLALVTTVFLFRLTLHLLPHPACGFWTILFLNQNIWLKDDLISATPRAFVYPLLTAFLYALVRRSLWLCLLTMALMGLFYPQLVLVQLGILSLRLFSFNPPAGAKRWLWSAGILVTGILVAAAVILPFQHRVMQQFGSILTAAQMQQMPEFGLDGRRQYFGVDPLSFWFRGASGLRLPLFPPILWLSLGLPILLKIPTLRTERQTYAIQWPAVRLLAQTLLASVAAFLLAHLLFPRLYLPSRYTFYSSRIVMALAAGIVWLILLQAGWNWLRRQISLRQLSFRRKLATGLAGLFIAAVIAVPAVPTLFLPVQGWVVGEHPSIYRFLASQPPQTLVASLSSEADNLPAFTQRSVLVSRELALAYHPAFYNLMQQRITDLITAQYSLHLSDIQTVIQKYGIDYWLLDQQFTDPDYLMQQDWLIHSSFAATVLDAEAHLKQVPALVQVIDSCKATSEDNLILLKADCISEIQSKSAQSK
jgi:hypothetical protein